MSEVTPERKVISGAVGAQAGSAHVAMNQPVQYAYREIVHHRVAYAPATGQEVKRETLVELDVTQGNPPKGFYRFQGLGTLQATIKNPQGVPQQHQEQYRFNVGALSLEEAWANYEEWAARGAEQAKDDFRRRYAAYEEEMRKRLLTPPTGLVGPGGAPLRPGG